MNGADAGDVGPSPTEFEANTSNVYGPATVAKVSCWDRAAAPTPIVCTAAPRLFRTITVYPVIADPPLPAAATALQLTVAVRAPPTAPWTTAPSTGATVGADAGVTGADATDGRPDPLALVAMTRKVYAVPFVSPVIVVLIPVLNAVATTVAPMRTWTV